MSKVVIAGDASGTGTFTISAPNGNTDRTLVLPDEAGTVLTSASSLTQNAGPAFFVYLGADQTNITNNVGTLIQLNTKGFDTHNYFNTSTYKFQPLIAGYYLISAGIVTPSAFSASYIQVDLVGASYKSGSSAGGKDGVLYPRSVVTALIYFNGTTDTIEARTYGGVSGGTYSLLGSSNQTWMTGCLIRTA